MADLDIKGRLVPQKPMDVHMTGHWPTFTCRCGKHTLGGENWGFLKFPLDPSQKTDDYTVPQLYFWCTSCGAYYEVQMKINQVRMEQVAQAAVDEGHIEVVPKEEVARRRAALNGGGGEHEGSDEEVQ